MIGIVVIPQPGANHIDIANEVYKRMEIMKKDLPDDVTYQYSFDNTKFIRSSINEVKTTVYEAFVLVIIIIFLLACNTCTVYCYSSILDRCFLRNVFGRIFHQCTIHASHCLIRRIGSR